MESHVNDFVARQLSLIEKERKCEIDEFDDLHARANLQDLQKRGVALLNLRSTALRSGLGGKSLIDFESDTTGQTGLPAHRFREGDIVIIEPMPKTTSSASAKPSLKFSGVVYRVKDNQITVACKGDDEVPDEIETGAGIWWKLTKTANDITYSRMAYALNSLKKLGTTSHVEDGLFKVLLGFQNPGFADFPMSRITFIDESMNDSQKEAIRFAMAAQQLALVHGPFGTGKTSTLIELIHQLVKSNKSQVRILVCGPSNTAVDNVLLRLTHSKIPLVRLGHPARVIPQLVMHTLDYRLRSGDDGALCNDIRNEVDGALKKLKKSKSSMEKKSLYGELKTLRKELRTREKSALQNIISNSNVVLSTLAGSDSRIIRDYFRDHPAFMFDYVIIDEAAQALEAECWIAILRARKVILAGDHLQLPAVVKSSKASGKDDEKDGEDLYDDAGKCKKMKELKMSKLNLEMSLFERLIRQFGNEGRRMLTVQYRMNEQIMEFSSKHLYNSALSAAEHVRHRVLSDLPGVDKNETTTMPLVLYDTTGFDLYETSDGDNGLSSEWGSESKLNEGEADVVVKYVHELVEYGVKPEDIGVITPYNAQVNLLTSLLREKYPELEIGSVDGFQGREKEVIVLSLVRSNERGEIGFLADKRRLNVAVTRAKRQVCLICDGETVGRSKFIKALVEFFEEHGELRMPE